MIPTLQMANRSRSLSGRNAGIVSRWGSARCYTSAAGYPGMV
jgi:hypothetical protein